MAFGLGDLFLASLLFLNAIAVLNGDRFLRKSRAGRAGKERRSDPLTPTGALPPLRAQWV